MNQFVSTPKDITLPNYFETTYILKRNGIYYLMYSEGKYTDSTYKVRYSTHLFTLEKPTILFIPKFQIITVTLLTYYATFV